MTLIQNKLAAANANLKIEKVGVSINIRRKQYFLRSMLPDKYDPDWTKLKQQRISIRLTAEDTNLIKAKKLALKLSSQKISRLFIWNEWLADEEKLAAQKKSLKISDIYKAFEDDFWSGEVERTPKKKRNWKSIAQYLAPRNKLTKPNSIKLEHHKLLTADYIISTVKKFKTEKTRFDMMKYCLRLARFGEIPDLRDVEKFSEKLDKYEPKTRDAKDPELMYNTVKELRSHKRFGWAIAAIFTYGCRVSEVWTLKPLEGHIAMC